MPVFTTITITLHIAQIRLQLDTLRAEGRSEADIARLIDLCQRYNLKFSSSYVHVSV